MEATEGRYELGWCDWQAIFVNNLQQQLQFRPSVRQLKAKVSQKREFALTTGHAGGKNWNLFTMNGDHWTTVKTSHSFYWLPLSFYDSLLCYTGPHVTQYWQRRRYLPAALPFPRENEIKGYLRDCSQYSSTVVGMQQKSLKLYHTSSNGAYRKS